MAFWKILYNSIHCYHKVLLLWVKKTKDTYFLPNRKEVSIYNQHFEVMMDSETLLGKCL